MLSGVVPLPNFGLFLVVLGAYRPTINWTIQSKAHPCPGPLRFRFKSSHVNGGFLEEDGEIWDQDGKLIAISRQSALLGVSQANRRAAAQSAPGGSSKL